MPTWSPLDPRFPAAVLLASICMPWAGAEELPASRAKFKRRSPVQQVSSETAASDDDAATARWKDLKSRYAEEDAVSAAAAAQRVARRPQKAAPIRPIPDDDQAEVDQDEATWDADESPTAEPESFTEDASDEPRPSDRNATSRSSEPAEEPLPITQFEDSPDWILGTNPLPAEETFDADDDDEEEREYPARTVGRSVSEGGDGSETQADPGYTPMLGSSASRRPRQINEISPKYDVGIDQDIREFAKQQASQYGLAFAQGAYQPRAFYGLVYQWEPSNFYHYPLYFEDPALERYGHTYNPVVQPMVSIARFGGQLIMLPYQMTLDPICTPKYALGYYRPGECAPKLHYQVPLNAQAAAVQAGVVTGLFYLIP